MRRAQYATVRGDSELKSPREVKLLSVTVKCSLVCWKNPLLLNLSTSFNQCLSHRLLTASDF